MNCDQIKAAIAEMLMLVDCRQQDENHMMVTGPFMNIEGDFPEVHVLETATGNFVITDYGESFRNLASNNIDALDSQTRGDILARVKAMVGIAPDNGRLQIEVGPNELSDGLHRMFQALVFVEDMVFTANPRDEIEFEDHVATRLRQLPDAKVQRKVPLHGLSGRDYKVDLRVIRQRDVWIEVISATTEGSFRSQVDRAHTMWTDQLRALGASPEARDQVPFRSITLLDDTSLGMEVAAVNILSRVSDVALWTKRDEFESRVLTLSS